MQTSLFDNLTPKQQVTIKCNQITKEKITQPLARILNSTISKNTSSVQTKTESELDKKSLNDLFPEQQFNEKNTKKAKEMLGEITQELTEAQLEDTVNEIRYLTTCWLDDIERKTFKGLTLNELLHEKGGV